MSPFQAAALALIQALSEFLPISSSGHLILLPRLVGWRDQGLIFDEALNTGTLLAVCLYFRAELLAMIRDGWRSLVERRLVGSARLGWQLGAGTVPVAVAGLLLDDWVGTAARSPALVATNLIVFGLVLAWADRSGGRSRDLTELRLRDAFLIGCAQALALVPGTSRSGITMTMALFLGFERGAAARFSFLLSVPVGLLVAVHDALEIARGGADGTPASALVIAVLGTAAAGYLVIGGLLAWVRRQSFLVFVGYRLLLGLTILGLLAAGVAL